MTSSAIAAAMSGPRRCTGSRQPRCAIQKQPSEMTLTAIWYLARPPRPIATPIASHQRRRRSSNARQHSAALAATKSISTTLWLK